MKKLFLPVFALITFFSQNAFAIHAYRSEHCVAESHELNYMGSQMVGGYYGYILPGVEDYIKAYPLIDGDTTSTLEDADVLFTELSWENTKPPVMTDACEFNQEVWFTKKVIEVNLISSEASRKLELKSGDKITYLCEETFDLPNGTECEE
jgi:hypothetical protein